MSMLNENQETKQPEAIRLVLERLEDLCTQRSLEPLKTMFWKNLGYIPVNQPLSFRNWRDASIVQDYLYPHDPLLLLATNKQNDFDVIYIHLSSSGLPLIHERAIIHNLLEDHFDALFIFSNESLDKWHFVNVKPDDKKAKRRIFRRFTVTQEEQLRTASEQLALLNITEIEDASSLEIQERHDEAFDVAAVTKIFFDEYQKQFRALQRDLSSQVGDMTWAHDYAHLFLNRCMFLYFIQRKRWLGGDKRFLRTFWNTYNENKLLDKEHTFFDDWLQVLFVRAFNQNFDERNERYDYFPSSVKAILAEAPFLGGLFASDSLDEQYGFSISDVRFGEIFNFFEGYNFTIAEDSPLDQEVAVDPEMIGRVYESLVNVSSELDERGDAGIFYTPRTEIDLMCRLSFVDYLANHLINFDKNLLYKLIFALEPHEKSDVDEEINAGKYWSIINTHLSVVTVLDPACGSGAFLVGMLKVLDDLQARANRNLQGNPGDEYDRRKRIIGQSLYGVDIMEWAARVAELRLWLILAVEPDIPLDQLHKRRDPILPYFTFKIRHGDSLIQQISENSGVVFAHKQVTLGISSILQRRLHILQAEKGNFYNSEPNCKFETRQDVEKEEMGIFIAILQEREQNLEKEIVSLNKKLALPKQSSLLENAIDEGAKYVDTVDVEALKWKKEIAEREDELCETQKARHSLENSERVPFVWDIGFVEIFSDNARGGFDIVVGNPPYVRQEHISNPLLPRAKVNSENKRAYKQKLAQVIHQAFSEFFQYKRETQKATHELDAKSDLYVYFYLHSLRLLNTKGSFCFITSNSWLDVGYGAVLQEFLLQYCKMKMIIDNAAKRSFATADVNTIIALFSSPGIREPEGQDAITRFVRFTVDFEQVLSDDVFIEIEKTQVPISTEYYRVHPISQRDLLIDGSTVQKEKQLRATAKKKQTNTTQHVLTQTSSYTGNKLGGKFLRAPKIYWVLMRKGKDKLKRLDEIAEVHYGIKTGANEFFYLDDEKVMQWQIEEKFLLPIIKSPTDCSSILVQSNVLRSSLFLCQKTEAELKGTAALEYIRWGESQGFHMNASVSGRTRWWSISYEAANSIFVKEAHNTSAVFYNPSKYPVDCRLYYADLPMTTLVYLNSIVGALLFEIYNRAGLGGGARSMMVSDYALVPSLCDIAEEREAERVLQQVYGLSARKLVLSDEKKLTSLPTNLFNEPWRALDDFIFDILHLTRIERDAVYEEVADLVEGRIKKAGSLNSRKKLDVQEHMKRKNIIDHPVGLWDSVLME